MKLTATVKLQPTDEQRQLLYATLERANSACNSISETAWVMQQFGRNAVHRLTYNNTRAEFGLTAQMAVRCIGKVVDAYKLDQKTKRLFKKLGAVPYDDRILNFRLKDSTVSIWLLGGRETIPFVTGEHQWVLLQFQRGESDLVHRKGEFYLYTTCDVPDNVPIDPEGWLGVDLGIANLAVDSDDEFFQGKDVQHVRHRHLKLRQKLQARQTNSARRKLKRLSGQEQRFATDVNHTISKRMVEKAQRHSCGIALENLEGIGKRVTVKRAQRAALHSWSFFQLRGFIEYKAQRAGIPVMLVDPRNTSRQCSACGYIDKANRPNQSTFSCRSCGHSLHADLNAARNISNRAAVNPPIVGTDA